MTGPASSVGPPAGTNTPAEAEPVAAPADRPRRRRGERLVSALTTVAFVIALVLVGLMLLPGLLGLQRYVIVSGSMEPTIPKGSVVYDEVVPIRKLRVGDVITFAPPPEFNISDPVTHRIIEIGVAPPNSDHAGQRTFRTKGDANDAPDAWTLIFDHPRQTRVVHHLPYVGYIYMALDHRWVQLLVVAVPALVIIIVLGVSLWRLAGEAVREERAQASP
jgi:signal peptidase I